MYRKFKKVLKDWECNKIKEPLLITGARQVGKTWIIQEFCHETYDDYLYINLESNPDMISVFQDTLNPEDIIRRLSILAGRTIAPETAVFIDEIQKSEQAITALKYFCESPKPYRIIGAGSLLGVKINRFESSFPVGKVQIHQMYPMDFEEFLIAAGQELLLGEIQNSFSQMRPMPDALHRKAIQFYQDYLFVGGMPQCINDYIQNECDVLRFNTDLQHYITLAYTADMAKYVTSAAESVKISSVYDSVPRQLARENPKFRYKEIRQNANRRDFYQPLDWLISSGMVYKVSRAELAKPPLKLYESESDFKIYLSDTGLLTYSSGMKYKDLLPGADNLYKGALTENYCVQQFAAAGLPLYYFKPNDSMEIDLLMDQEEGIIPVEIKSGRHKRSTSLNNYKAKYNPARMIRLSENNFGKAGELWSVPLYALLCLLHKSGGTDGCE